MNSVRLSTDRFCALFVASFVGLPAIAQPLCDVLLRPAFHFTSDGLTVTIADSSTTFGQLTTVGYSFGDGTTLAPQPTHTYEQPGTYTVCLTLATSTLGCSSTYCREITLPMDDCDGAIDAYFTSTGSGANSMVLTDASITALSSARTWEFGNGPVASGPQVTNTWPLPGPHFVALTRREGACAATYSRWVDVDGNATTCSPVLFTDFTISAEQGVHTFEPSIGSTNVAPVISIWSYGEGSVDTSAVGSHGYGAPGTYQTCLLVGAVELDGLDSCFSLVCRSHEVVPLTAMEEVNNGALLLWPNPCSDQVTVQFAGDTGNGRLEILEISGRIVFQAPAQGNGPFSLDISGIAPGLYVLRGQFPGRASSSLIEKLGR